MGVLSPVPIHPSGRKHLWFLLTNRRTCHVVTVVNPCSCGSEIGVANEKAMWKSIVSSTDARVSNKSPTIAIYTSRVENASDLLPSETWHHEIWVATQKYQQHKDKLEKGKHTRLIIDIDIVKTFPSNCGAAANTHFHTCATHTHASLTRTISLFNFANHMCTVLCCLSIISFSHLIHKPQILDIWYWNL